MFPLQEALSSGIGRRICTNVERWEDAQGGGPGRTGLAGGRGGLKVGEVLWLGALKGNDW